MIATLLFAAGAGFAHAFEADHLLAVSSIVTRRSSLWMSVKDGVAWGLGHSSTIFGIGILMIVGKVALTENLFHYFEAAVGLMLIVLGVHRLVRVLLSRGKGATAPHVHGPNGEHGHRLAYGVGLVHGLAGSGSLVLLVMSQIQDPGEALGYLLLFGAGSVIGMLLASGAFSLPLSKGLKARFDLRLALTVLSSALCIGLGAQVMFENLMA